jgi:hypothetical protein
MWENIVEANRPQVTVWRMRIICWIPKATNTLLEYVTLIAFPCCGGKEWEKMENNGKKWKTMQRNIACLVALFIQCVYDEVKNLTKHQQMHCFIIYTFYLSRSSYMFRRSYLAVFWKLTPKFLLYTQE